ncbi:hypothetical protein SRABI26_01738 [Arthrobacter sp. Bi26]|uniref:hypothetical protein n=1 Tax=Arthrobacter sp. Bi26 TaxID=2822350 RepID=UPI001D22039A|nr:hypothetical protein [Arthrobacter sp. Bi26]CAH0193590.1 hypothetical protein SRABI26_01738 [Arthrobacter sp. Bi26]
MNDDGRRPSGVVGQKIGVRPADDGDVTGFEEDPLVVRGTRIDAAGAGAADSWRTFERAWNRANTVRCALSIAGAAALAASLAR